MCTRAGASGEGKYTLGMWDVLWMGHILNLRGPCVPFALLYYTTVLLHSLISISLDTYEQYIVAANWSFHTALS
jgi:hypothetical protein